MLSPREILLHCIAICFVFLPPSSLTDEHQDSLLEGHLQPLFSHGKRLEVKTLDGFLEAEEFYEKYVNVPKPVLFRGGAMLFPAYFSWNREYFLSFPESEESFVTVEGEKKENRTVPGEDIPFAAFVRELDTSGRYMVNTVPEFLRQDVLLPPCIACDEITEGNLIQDMLWFSSGGTKSVLHNDYAENIMCVFQGTKEFFLIDKKYQDQVNVTELGYSSVDVDRVDLKKYPGLYKLEHYFAFLEPGDCLYVPFLWVHHVRSYDLNLAVNIWWRHGLQEINFNSCDQMPGRTIKDLSFIGFGSLHEAQQKMIKNRFILVAKSKGGQLSVGEFQELFSKPDVLGSDVQWTEDMIEIIKKLFVLMDQSADDRVTVEELDRLHSEDWEQIRVLVNDLADVATVEHDRVIDGQDNTEEEEEDLQAHTEL